METHKEIIKCPNCGHIQKKVYQKQYIVIADYPDSPFKIGDVLRFNGITWGTGEPQQFINNPEKYPNIFKTKNKHLTVGGMV